MEIEATEVVKINAKTLKMHLKVCDRFTASLVSATGTVIHDQEDGYVPSFMPEQHYGDYVILDAYIPLGYVNYYEYML